MTTSSMKSFCKHAAMASLAILVVAPMAASATCTITGPIVRVTAYADSYSATGCSIYVRPSALATFYYSAITNDDDMCSNAVVAATTGVDATVQGDTASCPTTGTNRSMGALNYIIINP
jgi:hypothetical protein